MFGVFVSGCVSLHKEDDAEIVIPERIEVDETVIETPLPFEVSDENLKLFLDDLKFSVESHNWDRVILFFDRNDYESRKGRGVTQSAHIQNGFGVDRQNSLDEKQNDFSEYSKLNNIKTMTFAEAKKHETVENFYIVTGIVKQYSGPDRRFQIYIYKSGSSYSIIPPSS